MKKFVLAFFLAASLTITSSNANETEGLFIEGERIRQDLELKDGEFVLRFKAVRMQILRAVLRYDTDDRTRCWLEIDIGKEGASRGLDPGDFYLFRIDGKDYAGFSTRGQFRDEKSEGNWAGWRWALNWGTSELEEGRKLLAKIGKTYNLPAEQVIDQTK